MNATTGLAWWAGTGSFGGISGSAEDEARADVAVAVSAEVEESMHGHKMVRRLGGEHGDVEVGGRDGEDDAVAAAPLDVCGMEFAGAQ